MKIQLRRLLPLLAATFLPPDRCGAAESPEGWFTWPSVMPAAGSALDASTLNQAPAGEQGPVRVEKGRFVTGKGEPLRFWGTNICAYDAFPSSEDAVLLAARLARGGVNIARLHHLDNLWGVGNGGSLWRADRAERLEFDEAQLDKLHRLWSELTKAGIYINLNLKCSKSLTEADGLPASVREVPDFQKRVDMFQRRMIDLQKDYARRLLHSRNPYTGLRLVDDPALAVVEINNENSLLGFWTRDLGRGTTRFAEPFRTELKDLWNAWLARRYADEHSLRAAWSEAGPGEALSCSGNEWHLSGTRGSRVEMLSKGEGTGIELQISGTTGTDWHSSAGLGDYALVDGKAYTVELTAAADRPFAINVVMSLAPQGPEGDPWRSMGLFDPVRVDTELRTHRVSFVAHSVGGAPARLGLNLGQQDGRLRVQSLVVRAGVEGSGLLEGQAPNLGTVPIPERAGSRQWADWLHFLADTDRAFAEEMRRFLKEELGVRAPMVCSQVDYGGLIGMNRERPMDFADSHAYWQHPDFAATGMWSPSNWTIRNSPQIAEFKERSFGELGNMALVRVAGKPFALSEYDHPAPTEYACEMYPVLATFGARQNWDAIYPFALDANGSRNPDGRIRSFFDQLNHPAKWGFAPFAARVFRQGLVPAAPAAVLRPGEPCWAESPHGEILWKTHLPPGRIPFLDTAFGLSDRPGAEGARAVLEAAAGAEERPLELRHDKEGTLYLARTPQALAVVGHIGGREASAGGLSVQCEPFGRGFAAITAVSLDGLPVAQSRRVLVSLAARAENSGMVWNALRTSVGDQWGQGPTLAERVPARLRLAVNGARRVFALAPDGSRTREVSAVQENGSLAFRVEERDRTLHYEIVGD